MLCPLLSRHQVDPATGQGEWIHQECLGAQCKFYNISEADCQFLLTSRSGNVTLPTAATGDAIFGQSGGSGPAGAGLGALLETTLKAPLQDMRAAQEEAAARLRRLEETLTAEGGAAPEVSRQIEAAFKKTLKSLQATQESIDSRLRGLESALASQAKDYDRARSEISDQVEAGLKKPLKNLFAANDETSASLRRIEEALSAQREQAASTSSQAAAQLDRALESALSAVRAVGEGTREGFSTLGQESRDAIAKLNERHDTAQKSLEQHDASFQQVEERLKMLGADQQEALRTLQAVRDTVGTLPSKQEELAARLQADLEKALSGHTRTLTGKLGEEFVAHSREQLKNFEATEENSLRHHGRLLQEIKKNEETHQTVFAELRTALAAHPGEFQGIAKQVKDLHQFTHDALDTARQRGEGLWSQVETVGRSIGQLALILKSLQAEIEKANGGITSVRGDSKGVLLAFHEHKMAVQEEHKRKQAETAREFNNKGVALFQRGSLEAAVEAFIRAVELRPDFAEAYNNLGLAYSKRGQSEEAVRYFQKAVELDPGMGEVYNNLGFLFHTSARFDRAIEMFTRSLQSGADQSIAYTNLGNTFYRMKQNEKAVAAWKKALDIDPLNESARRGLTMFQQEPAGAPPPGTAPSGRA